MSREAGGIAPITFNSWPSGATTPKACSIPERWSLFMQDLRQQEPPRNENLDPGRAKFRLSELEAGRCASARIHAFGSPHGRHRAARTSPAAGNRHADQQSAARPRAAEIT